MGIYIKNKTGNKFYIGPEKEHTPANGKKTLFVIGTQDTSEIETIAMSNKTPHIYFGTDGSFTFKERHSWENQLVHFLDRGFTVTLEYPAEVHTKLLGVLSPGVWQSRLFIPLVRIGVERLETSSPNLTIKLSDVDGNRNGNGAWCFHYHELTDSNRFTDINHYEFNGVDTPVKEALVEKTKSEPVLNNPQAGLVIEAAPPLMDEPVLNNQEIGLDLEPTTALKEDPEEVETEPPLEISTNDAAELYADPSFDIPTIKDIKPPKKVKAKKASE